MRLVPVFALMTSALSLAACGGAGGGLGGSGVLSANSIANGVGGCPITAVDTSPTNDCNNNTPPPVVKPPALPDADGDGIPDKDDKDGGIGSGAGGNTTRIVAGNKAIVLKQFVYDAPTSAAAMAQVLVPATTTQAYTDGLILGAVKPTTLIHYTDTKSDINGQFATPVVQEEYAYGTRDLDWIGLGHHTFNLGTLSVTALGQVIGVSGATPVSYAGYPILTGPTGLQNVVWDPFDRKYKTATRNFNPDPDNDPDTPMPDWNYGVAIDPSTNFYWNQVRGFMDSRANGGTGQNYREYRALAPTAGRDEVLQVWAFDDSYATQYQNAANGGIPKHQVWAFGGNKATALPVTGNANYAGRWVGTAETKNWTKPDGAVIDPNALWRVEGNSKFTANFATGDIRGTLTPESWTSFQENGLYTWFTADSGRKKNGSALEPDYSIIYDTSVNINAKAGQVTTPLGTTRGPDFTGEADLSGAYITGDNPVYGGFFGTGGSELTGVFSAAGVYPNPQGGSQGINDNRRGNLNMNGAFNANNIGPCVPNVTCVPAN